MTIVGSTGLSVVIKPTGDDETGLVKFSKEEKQFGETVNEYE